MHTKLKKAKLNDFGERERESVKEVTESKEDEFEDEVSNRGSSISELMTLKNHKHLVED